MEHFLNPWSATLMSSGLFTLLSGYLMWKFPPKKINMLYGYRSSNAMKDQKRWDFAQVYAGRGMALAGIGMFLSGIAGPWIPLHPVWTALLSILLLIAFFGYVFFSTEKALKREFGA